MQPGFPLLLRVNSPPPSSHPFCTLSSAQVESGDLGFEPPREGITRAHLEGIGRTLQSFSFTLGRGRGLEMWEVKAFAIAFNISSCCRPTSCPFTFTKW